MSEFRRTERSTVRRLPKRATYDRDAVHAIVDEALICHVGFVQDGRPFVIPTLHARMDDEILLHGSKASRLLHHVESGVPVCIACTIPDGMVLARSVFHHSMNYRSAVLFGKGRALESEEEKLRALERFTEKILPGRWPDARRPSAREMAATAVVSVEITEASAKARTGPPVDDEEDYALPVWAGVLPLGRVVGIPQADPRLSSGIQVPEYVESFVKRSGGRPGSTS